MARSAPLDHDAARGGGERELRGAEEGGGPEGLEAERGEEVGAGDALEEDVGGGLEDAGEREGEGDGGEPIGQGAKRDDQPTQEVDGGEGDLADAPRVGEPESGEVDQEAPAEAGEQGEDGAGGEEEPDG